MALLATRDWYDIARDTNWTPSYVSEEALPAQFSDPYGLPVTEWERFDEPYKITYRDYVRGQREKDSGAYSVKSALARIEFYRNCSPEWKSLLQLHFGAVPFRTCAPTMSTRVQRAAMSPTTGSA